MRMLLVLLMRLRNEVSNEKGHSVLSDVLLLERTVLQKTGRPTKIMIMLINYGNIVNKHKYVDQMKK